MSASVSRLIPIDSPRRMDISFFGFDIDLTTSSSGLE